MDELEKIVIKKFFNEFHIDLNNEDIIELNNVKLFNFYKNQNLTFIYHLSQYEAFEFCHSLNKIYLKSNFLNHNLCYYECEQIQIEKNDIIFDCGGNFGLFAAVAATKGKVVYSFEPMSLIRLYLQKMAQLYSNIIIVPYGLSNKNKIVKFNQCDNPAASYSTQLGFKSLINYTIYTEQVQLITLDDFISQNKIYPTFIKADIEGSELEMLIGGYNYIINYTPKLSISIHQNNLNKINYIKSMFTKKYDFIIQEDKHKGKERTEDILLLGVPK